MNFNLTKRQKIFLVVFPILHYFIAWALLLVAVDFGVGWDMADTSHIEHSIPPFISSISYKLLYVWLGPALLFDPYHEPDLFHIDFTVILATGFVYAIILLWLYKLVNGNKHKLS